MPGPTGFIAVLPQNIIHIPPTSNLSWLTLFYALPRELVEKRPEYLSLPRNINTLLASESAQKLVEDDQFVELVWDCYAWSVWQFFKIPLQNGTYRDIPGDWKNYSGDFPLWRMSYMIQHYIRDKYEHEMEWSFQRLFMMPEGTEVPWLSYQHFGNLIGNITDLIVTEQNWQPMIDEIWKNRQLEDYNGKSVFKNDFMKSWDHTRAVKKKLSIDDLENMSAEELDSHGLSDNSSDVAMRKVSIDQFKDNLSERDRQILEYRMQGRTLEEIAQLVGYQNAGAVSKRLDRIISEYKQIEE